MKSAMWISGAIWFQEAPSIIEMPQSALPCFWQSCCMGHHVHGGNTASCPRRPRKFNSAAAQSGNFSCLMAPAGPWELAFCFGVGRRDLFFARKREKKIGCFFAFLVVFLPFWW